MAFRTLEISKPTEIHIKNNQLLLYQMIMQKYLNYYYLRNFLIKDGYKMYIPEVYMRIFTNRKSAKKNFKRIGEFLPNIGAITALKLTEKQFENIISLVGEMDKSEKIVGKKCSHYDIILADTSK